MSNQFDILFAQIFDVPATERIRDLLPDQFGKFINYLFNRDKLYFARIVDGKGDGGVDIELRLPDSSCMTRIVSVPNNTSCHWIIHPVTVIQPRLPMIQRDMPAIDFGHTCHQAWIQYPGREIRADRLHAS